MSRLLLRGPLFHFVFPSLVLPYFVVSAQALLVEARAAGLISYNGKDVKKALASGFVRPRLAVANQVKNRECEKNYQQVP